VYTVRDVVDEIRDAATKQRLRVLPYEIKMMEPSPDAIVRGNYCHYCLES
jgi:RNA-binding protein NOB1